MNLLVTLNQTGLNMHMGTLRSPNEHLAVANETKANVASCEHWRAAISAQENLIENLYPNSV